MLCYHFGQRLPDEMLLYVVDNTSDFATMSSAAIPVLKDIILLPSPISGILEIGNDRNRVKILVWRFARFEDLQKMSQIRVVVSSSEKRLPSYLEIQFRLASTSMLIYVQSKRRRFGKELRQYQERVNLGCTSPRPRVARILIV